MVKVTRLKPLEEGWQQRACAVFTTLGPCMAADAESEPPPPALFEMEGLSEIDDEGPLSPAAGSDSQRHAMQAIASLLQPLNAEDQAVYSAAVMAATASNGSLEATAHMLARLGYTVRLHTSAGGSLYRLKHSYITATRNLATGGLAEWVIDPSFAQAFAVSSPTPRFAHILAAVPPVLVAPLPRLVRALLLLGAELAQCFEEKGLSLPPWRQVEALASRYDAATSILVHSGDVVTPPAAEEESAAAHKQQREQQQSEQVKLHLARLGLLHDGPAAAEPRTPPCSTSPASHGGSPSGGSPRSVLAASQPRSRASNASGRIQGFPAAAQAAAQPVLCGRWKPSRFQPARQHAGLLGCRMQQGRRAASAA